MARGVFVIVIYCNGSKQLALCAIYWLKGKVARNIKLHLIFVRAVYVYVPLHIRPPFFHDISMTTKRIVEIT